MSLGINYDQEYLHAQIAYVQGNYEEAATLVNRLVQDFPDDPSSHLLQGNIYCILQEHDLAREQYQVVLNLTKKPELVDCANNGLESVNLSKKLYRPTGVADHDSDVDDIFVADDFLESSDSLRKDNQQKLETSGREEFDVNNFNLNPFKEPAPKFEQPFDKSFRVSRNASLSDDGESLEPFANPFN